MPRVVGWRLFGDFGQGEGQAEAKGPDQTGPANDVPS
jgi:hypothetical protein